MRKLFFCLLISLTSSLFSHEVVIDLKDASYENGVISTQKGGVVCSGPLRIQALAITYIKNKDEGISKELVYASKNLLVLFQDKILTGKSLEYNFETNEGIIYDGLVASGPLVVGGKKIHFSNDGVYTVEEGYVTLSDCSQESFALSSKCITISKYGFVKASNIHLKLCDFPFITFPDFQSDTKTAIDLPFQMRFTLGGVEGSYATIRYKAISFNHFNAYIRADWVFGRGPGAGIDLDYCKKASSLFFKGKNFAVYDRSYDDPNNRLRYRIEGHYRELFCQNKVKARVTYDFLSDTEMGSDFSSEEFELETSKRTELSISRKEDLWIGDFQSKVKVNSFQTVAQELPLAAISVKPLSIASTSIISNTRVKAGYLNYSYAEGTPNINNFDSSRVELTQSFYRPFTLYQGTRITPEIGGVLIHYSRDNLNQASLQAMGYYGFTATTQCHKIFGPYKHVLEPYFQFQGYSTPTLSQTNTPIFTIQDGYSEIQLLKLGIKNALYEKTIRNQVIRSLFLDLWAYGLYGTNTTEKKVPRVYASLNFFLNSRMSCRVDAGYNREKNYVDLLNIFYKWTYNEDFAISLDLLTRGNRYWRKSQYDNFMLDAFRTETDLQNSLLSDQRNTLVSHLFYRFHPNWRLELKSRLGWNRQNENAYFEYKCDLETAVGCNWFVKFGYEKREIDNRFIFMIRLGKQRPGEGLY